MQVWQDLSNKACALLEVTGQPGVLTWLLDTLADAELHPSQRQALAFPRLFKREVASSVDSLSRFSDDELCLAWSAFDRLQLVDKQTALLFFQAVSAPLPSLSDSPVEQASQPRYSRFGVRHWLWAAQGLREFAWHHPIHMDFVEEVVLKLLVGKQKELTKQRLQLEALHAITRMARLSSRQMHRCNTQLQALLPTMSDADLATVPRLCARAELSDEDLFVAITQHLKAALPRFEVKEALAVLKGLLDWRVGLSGLRRSAAAALAPEGLLSAKAAEKLSPSATLRLIRALGRLDETSLRGSQADETSYSTPGREESLLVSMLMSLLAVMPRALPACKTSELVLAVNALGQVSRGWSWLGDGLTEAESKPLETLREAASQLAEAVVWQLKLGELHLSNEILTSHDLALLVLGQARIARRSCIPGQVPVHVTGLCEALAQCTPFERPAAGSALPAAGPAVAAASMLLMHSAKAPQLRAVAGLARSTAGETDNSSGDLSIAVLNCLKAWVPHCVATGHAGREIHKAIAAAAAFGAQLLRMEASEGAAGVELSVLTRKTQKVLHMLLLSVWDGKPEPGQIQDLGESLGAKAELWEGWHLDGCLHATAVLAALHAWCPDSALGGLEELLETVTEALVSEASRRRSTFTERTSRFWLTKLFEPGVLQHSQKLQELLCQRLLQVDEEALSSPSSDPSQLEEGPLSDPQASTSRMKPVAAAALRDGAAMLLTSLPERAHEHS